MVVEGRAKGRRRRVVGSFDDILAVWRVGIIMGWVSRFWLRFVEVDGPSSSPVKLIRRGGGRTAGTSEERENGSFRGSGRRVDGGRGRGNGI